MPPFVRRCLIGGLLVWLPILATLFVLRFIIELLDSTLSLLPRSYQPENLIGVHIPGLGVVLAILVLFLTGLLVSNFAGRRIVNWWDRILQRIPLVRTVHAGVKQILETVLITNGQSFRQVLLIKFPHAQSWTIAFLVGQGLANANQAVQAELLTVFVPTAPNPTSGYILMVPKNETIELAMSVDEALKFVISLGVVQPSPVIINQELK